VAARTPTLLFVATVAISVFVLLAIGNAQVDAPRLSEVRVTVVDQSGAVIPDSEIVFTGDSKPTVFLTGADGSVTVRVPSGTYAIKTTRAGFLTNEIHDFRAGTLRPSELRIVLKIDPDVPDFCSGPTCGAPPVVPTTTSDVPQSGDAPNLIIEGIIENGAIDGHDAKVIGGMGDPAAVILTRVLAERDLRQLDVEGGLWILAHAFTGDRCISFDSDRKPRAAFLLLRYFALSTTDPKLKEQIADVRAGIERNCSSHSGQ
jgi:hypothetical protein